MSSTVKNTIVVAVVVIVILALFFVFRNKSDQEAVVGSEDGTSTVSSSGGTSNGGTNTSNPSSPIGMSDETLNTLLDSALIRVPSTGIDVALTKGTANFTNGTIKGTLTRGKIFGKIPTENGYDVFTNLVITTQNSSSSVSYVALFKVSGGIVTYTSAVMVGDRVVVQGVLAIADPNAPLTTPQQYFNSDTTYILNINYLDRKNGESITTTPTVSKTVQARVKNHLVTI
ncbi:MAG: hypothetical protein V4664_03620 [Patescibacteria group bacterium]